MFTLESLHLENFGAIRESTFTPKESELTSIYGANGNGKSSFLDAIVWALFGVIPKDRKQTEIRNFYAEEKESTKVIVTFKHEGDTITVTRSISAKGSVKADVRMNGGKSPMTKTTPTTAVNWVKKRLGINEEGFTKAFAIRQKELDDLVTATATRRREIIERISGVDRLSRALKLSKEEEKHSKIVFENATDPTQELKSLKDSLKKSEKELETVESNMEASAADTNFSSKARDIAYENWQESNTHRQVYLDTVNQNQSLEHKISMLESNISNNESRIKDKQANIEGDKESVQKEFEASAQKAQEIRNEVSSLKTTITTAERELDRYDQSLATSETNINKSKTEVKTAQANLKATEDELAKYKKAPYTKKKLTQDENEANKLKETSSNSLALAQNLKRSLEKNIDILSSHTGEAHCPTCKKSLEDTTELLNEFNSDLSETESQIKDAETGLESAQKALEDVQRRKDELEKWNKDKDKVKQDKENNEYFLNVAKSELEDRESDRESVLGSLNVDEKKKEIDSLNEEVKRHEDGLEALLDHGRKLRTFLDSFSEVETLKEELSGLKENVAELEQEKAGIVFVEEVTSDKVEEAKKEHDEASSALESAMSRYSSMEQDYYMLKSDVAVNKERVESLESQKDAYENAKHKFDEKAATSLLIAEFRKNTISRIAPEIASSSSAVVSSMTADEFTAITMDDEFTPTVVRANGRSDSMNLLSGGEKSLVALSILVGIGDLISGGSGGLLWLDEALVSQDATRRNLIVATLRSLDNRQIVMVNHTPDGNDLSDTVVELVRGESGSHLRDS